MDSYILAADVSHACHLHNGVLNPVPLGLPALAGSPLLQYDRADRCFVTTTRRTPIYPRGGSWVRAEGSNPQIVAHQQLVSYYQRHPPAHPEDVFAILRINVEPAQTTENLQSPVNEQPFELPDVQYVPIEAPELPPAPPAPTNAPVEVPMATFTQADIDQRIAVALAAYQSQQSTANRPLRLDIPAPEPFSGKAEDLRRFIQCILSYFVATNNTRLSDEAKIAFTVALMRKDLGKTWADAYYEKSAGGVQVYPDWAAFATALEEAFPEHGTRIKAHQILMKLPERQKNKKTALSLGNYVTRFEQLASKAQLKDAEVNGVNRTENDYHTLHANFVKGLPKELYVSLATRVARDRPNTMKAWYDEVRNADAAEQGALTVTDTRDYGEPMDIDAAAVAATFASTSGGRKWELGAVLNEADRKLHRDGNLCFYCHIKGHSAKDCRKKAAARQGGGRPNQGGSGKDDFRARIKTLSADEKRELRLPIPSPFLQATPRSTTIPADWQPNPGWTPKGSCRRCGSSRHWVRDCPDVRCAGCGKEAPGHLERECGTRPMKRHVSAPPEEPARRVGVVVDNVFLEGIINEARERKEKERQMKAIPIPPPHSANPKPPTSPVAGPSRPRPDTPVIFRKVDPDWTPDTTQWTWDSSWPNQKHLSGEEWMNVGRNARKEWFDEEEDDSVDWELYGDGEHLHNGVRAHFVPGIVPLRFFLH
ncbi:predicted protein [Postia placenta Mad-698-R]|nr:predicted protein [Postia placenta Mad-698-R]